MMQKDVLPALELGRKLIVPVPTTTISNEFLTVACGMGLEKPDFAAAFEVLAGCQAFKGRAIAQPPEGSARNRAASRRGSSMLDVREKTPIHSKAGSICKRLLHPK